LKIKRVRIPIQPCQRVRRSNGSSLKRCGGDMAITGAGTIIATGVGVTAIGAGVTVTGAGVVATGIAIIGATGK
jgi:hypothetical protein